MDRRRPKDPQNPFGLRACALALAVFSLAGCSSQLRSLAALQSLADDVTVTPTAPTATWTLQNGTSSIDLRATPNRDVTVYYAAYSTDQGTLDASQVKAAALACSGACVAGGSYAATSAGTTHSISSLADKAKYSVYAAAEDADGLQTSVQHYTGVLPMRLSLQTYATIQNSKIGVGATVRYVAYVPRAYYDNPTTNYPVIMYVHGGGERSNDPANPESDSTALYHTPFAGFIASGDDFPAIMVAPQCNEGLWDCINTGSTNYLAEVIDEVNANFRTNPKKFSVIGMSWGGAGALQLAYDYPAKISAVLGVAGGIFYRPADAATLCGKFATNKVAFWGVNNTFDPWYNQAAVNGGGGTYPGDVVNTITANCTGYPDARFTEYSDNTTFPVNFHQHLIFEFTVGSSYWDYGNCSGGNAWKSWNGTSCSADTDPPAYRVPVHPVMTAALQTASTALTGSSTTFTSVVDWLLYFEKP